MYLYIDTTVHIIICIAVFAFILVTFCDPLFSDGTSWPWSYGSWIYNNLWNQWSEFESRTLRGVQHYVIKLVSDLRQVSGFVWILRFPPSIKLTTMI